jgi:N-acetylglucosamine malate deacetylase 1
MADVVTQDWDTVYWRWLEYVVEVGKTLDLGASVPLGPSSTPLILPGVSPPVAGAPKVIVCSPHPDDEALIGALPLRLRMESGARVVDCAITCGSNLGQRQRRLKELESACRVLGFGLVVPDGGSGPQGFDHVNQATREKEPKEWAAKVQALAEIFDGEKPDAVFAPHAEDFNTTHIGTHYLVTDALGTHLERSGRGLVPLIETEFWHQMFAPNLMVGVTPEVVAIQLMATAEHGGEVSRNPYHLRQPARMMDNVRRGSEVVGGQGGAAHPYLFAELYNVRFMKGKEIVAPRAGGSVIAPRQKASLETIVAPFRP